MGPCPSRGVDTRYVSKGYWILIDNFIPMTEYTFSRFAYFDTNILSYLAKNQALWAKLLKFLGDNDLTLGISGTQIVELSDANRLHHKLVALFISVPSALLKIWDSIIAEEVKSYPEPRKETLLLYPLNALLLEQNGLDNLLNFLSSRGLRDARNDQLHYARQMLAEHNRLKTNFPPSKSGKYTREQADKFAQEMVRQWLAIDHLSFLAGFQDPSKDFLSEVFISVRLYAYVIFYKYYLGQREPRKLSDFADLGHLFFIPYCNLVVIEKDLCNVLNQIKRNHDILGSTEIKNIDFLHNLD